MHIVHGTWIPDKPGEFVQSGAFAVWIETDTPVRAPHRQRTAVHPRHLADAALTTFLTERLGLGASRSALHSCSFLLPSADGAPLPSVELLPYTTETAPSTFEYAWWQVCCYRVPRIISTLNEIHFAAMHAADEFQLGADLLFWYHWTQTLKLIITRDQYIPALKYRQPAQGPGNGRRKHDHFELYPGWELVSELYAAMLPRYVAAMPAVCTAGSTTPSDVALFDRETLLRHFSECLIHDVVTGTPFPAGFHQRIAGTLLSDCLDPSQPTPVDRTPVQELEMYRQWAAWRETLAGSHAAARFTLCFRLEEAPATDVDAWQVQFQVASKADPSYRLSLADYWQLKRSARAAVVRRLGADFEKHLLLGLGHAARIYPKIWEGLETAQPIGFRLTLDGAFAFLKEDAWVLEDAGYAVIVPAWWTPEGRRRVKVRLRTAVRPSQAGPTAQPGGFFNLEAVVDYQYQLSIGGQPVSESEWQQLVAAKTPLVQFRGQWMELDRDRMQQLLEFWQTRRQSADDLRVLDLLKLANEAEDDLEWDHAAALGAMLAKLHDKSAFAPIEDPPTLRGTLREYQRRGVAWLRYLESLGLNPCLADDMGLGKSIQVIARLLGEHAEIDAPGPTLLIAPTSVLSNWRREIERFAPELRTVVHQGSTRIKDEAAFQAVAGEHDVVVTSFALARLDEKLLRGVAWRRLVVDEAQNIKNPQSAQARAIAKIAAPHRLALTGTPVENRLLDLWSIFNFLHPGYLGKQAQFRRTFEMPIQRNHDLARSATLKRLVEPFILRRLKTDKRIIDDLPEKVEQTLFCNLTPEQASLYEAVVRDVAAQLESAEGIQRRGLMLATLLKLKQICNHPSQFLQDGSAFVAERSHKLQRLAEMLEEVVTSGDSALVFTQFTEIGAALERYLVRTHHYPTAYLHGGTSVARREQLVAAFQDPDSEPTVFVLSLRAGGVGLNLTRANHVFNFDRWWNPAVENQATDRAFRIGQRKNVFVHKFVAIGTLEERIDQLIEDKKHLSSTIVGSDESWLTELDNQTFTNLIALQRSAVLE
jgi:SNF2 family DNA or RNA helicase